jgi:hypothetical protein
MSAVLGTFEQYTPKDHAKLRHFSSAALNWLGNIFGCPHKELSRPFSRQGETYRVCINCGARRHFDQQSWNSAGPFYFDAATTSNLVETNVSSLRAV